MHFDKASSLINKYEEEVLKSVFPNARFSQTNLIGSPDKPIKTFEGVISTDDGFKDSRYFHDGKHNFLHFTSLQSLGSILKSGFLRMTELDSLTDKGELNYALNQLNFNINPNSHNWVEKRRNLFCLSACEANENTRVDSFMWETYGNKGKGISIEYKFTKPDAFQFEFGRILYGKDELDDLKKVIQLSQNFSNKHDFQILDLPFVFSNFMAFHKAKVFENEQEIRLLYNQDGSFGKPEHLTVYKDFYKDNEVRRFLKIFIKGCHDLIPHEKLEDEVVLNIAPQIEIERILLGPNLDAESLLDIVSFLKDISSEKKISFEIWKVNKEKECYKIG